jgi:predicted amidohydrolase
MFLSCRVLFCNRVGYEDGVNFWGGSELVTPGGESIARGKLLEEDLVIAAVEEGALRRERICAPLLRDENLSLTLAELERINALRRGSDEC